MKIVLASNNQGKLNELKTLFKPLRLELISQGDLFVGEAKEPYFTFIENALTKARFASEKTNLPSIADDAGLCVDVFNGNPGVNTAYYCEQFGYKKSDENNINCLLEQLNKFNNRNAVMISVLVAIKSLKDPEPLIAIGRIKIQIATEKRGNNGFGFDPILLIPELNKTFAELKPEIKNSYSHRGLSSKIMVKLLKDYWNL